MPLKKKKKKKVPAADEKDLPSGTLSSLVVDISFWPSSDVFKIGKGPIYVVCWLLLQG